MYNIYDISDLTKTCDTEPTNEGEKRDHDGQEECDRTLPETKDKATGRKRTLTITFCPEVQTLGRSMEDITSEVREKIVRCLGE